MTRLKKTICISIVIVAVLATLFAVTKKDRANIAFIEMDGTTFASIHIGNNEQVISPWYSEVDEVYYYFIPSFAKDCFSENEVFDILVNGEKEKAKALCSENVTTVFFKTDSGSNERLLEDIDNVETGEIQSVTSDGKTEYLGQIEKLKGRGNSTWGNEEKKPLNLVLKKEASLCGLKTGKRYAFHAMCYEGDKMHSKFIYDMEKELGAEFTTGTNWADVYLNGEYYGLYLVEEAHKVDKGRIELSKNGILFQKASSDRTGDGSYFTTNDGDDYFLTEYPKEPTDEQLYNMEVFVRIIDDQIHQGDFSNIDMESFARYFLADELSLGYDAFKNSCYFYQKEPGGKLYAGPVWDYDLSFGETNFGESKYADPTFSMLDARTGQLDWYQILYENEEFRAILARDIEELYPWYKHMLESKIDEQTAMLNKSVSLDKLRWSNEPASLFGQEISGSYPSVSVSCKSYKHPGGSYKEFENNVKFFKYFLSARLNYLMDEWGVEAEKFNIPSSKETHTVSFVKDGMVVKEMEVVDGDFITEFPDEYLDESQTWRMSWCLDIFNDKLPIYEDTVLRAVKEE